MPYFVIHQWPNDLSPTIMPDAYDNREQAAEDAKYFNEHNGDDILGHHHYSVAKWEHLLNVSE